MRIIDTYGQMTTAFPAGRFDLAQWRAYAAHISPTFSEKIETDVRGYDMDTEILPVVNAALANPAALAEAHASFQRAAAVLPQRTMAVLGESPVTVVFYLGLCSGAGWATELDTKPAVLIGVEKVLELGWGGEKAMAGLICHELGHSWMGRAASRRPSGLREASVRQLFSEGIAMYVEQLLLEDEFWHQDAHGWLSWCQAHRGALAEEFCRRLAKGEDTKAFFGDWRRLWGQPDTGYYLGGVFVRALAKTRSLNEIAAMELPEVDRALCAFAAEEGTTCRERA